MASGYKVYIPNGTSAVYSLREGQTWKDVVSNHLLAGWIDYCNNNWLSANHENMFCGERKVKSFLNQCAYLMSLDDPDGIESEYKRMKHEVTEIPVSCAPEDINDMYYSAHTPPRCEFEKDGYYQTMIEIMDTKPVRPPRITCRKKHNQTKFEKTQKILADHPGCKFVMRLVDTNGCFHYNGRIYMVSPDEEKYRATKSQNGEDVYIMDTVNILCDDNDMVVYDMNMDEIKWSEAA